MRADRLLFLELGARFVLEQVRVHPVLVQRRGRLLLVCLGLFSIFLWLDLAAHLRYLLLDGFR